jgi:ribosomal protein S6--L-glutamate ligase
MKEASMNVCLIMGKPETPRHQVIATALHHLSATHTVRLLDLRGLSGPDAIAQEDERTPADLYLLKSHAPQALELARWLEERGALVVNTWASTSSCQDRALMAQRMRAVGLPWPRTWSLATLESLLAHPELLVSVPMPLVLKSRYSRRGDLVVKVDRVEQIQALTARWSQEPVIVQELVSSDGWDIKVWVIDHQVWAARRRSALDAQSSADSFPVAPDDLPRAWASLALEIGQVFNLRLYGVDLLIAEQGLIAVDVNAFPGFRGAPGASSALVALIEQIGWARRITA